MHAMQKFASQNFLSLLKISTAYTLPVEQIGAKSDITTLPQNSSPKFSPNFIKLLG